MERFTYNGETYRINGDKIYDEHFIIPHDALCVEVVNAYCATKDVEKISDEELRALVKLAKRHNAMASSLKLAMEFYNRNQDDEREVRMIIPVITSIFRGLGQPQKAIDFTKVMFSKYGKHILNVAAFTSLAGAYCDVKDYPNAAKYCDVAYALQGGGVGYKNETSLVYKRIYKESNGKYGANFEIDDMDGYNY